MINRKFSISKIQDAKTIANGGRVGSKFQNVFNFGNRQVSYFTPKVGTNKINILPYEIKQMISYSLRIEVHFKYLCRKCLRGSSKGFTEFEDKVK